MKRPLALMVVLGCLALTALTSPGPSVAAPIYTCASVGIFAGGSSVVLNASQGGVPSCVFAIAGTLTLAGSLNAAADLGTQAGTTTYTYESSGLLDTASGPVGTATFSYDSQGRLMQSTDPIGHTTTYHYNSLNQVIDTTDYLSRTTTYQYEGSGRLTETHEEGGHTTTYGYDSGGRLSLRSDNLGHTTVYQYNASDRLIQTTDDGTAITNYSYNALNQLDKLTDFLGVRGYVYDANGDAVLVTDYIGRQTRFTYEPVFDQIRTIADPDGATRAAYTVARPIPVPAPGGLLLLGAGLAGLLAVRRRAVASSRFR